MAEKGYPITDEFIEYFKNACDEANQSLNSIRNGRKFSYISRVEGNNLSIKVRLESQTAVIPTRAMSSITRALLKSDIAPSLQGHEYKGCIITAYAFEVPEETFSNMSDTEVVQAVVDVFFGKMTSNKDKEQAKIAANAIRATIQEYKSKIKP